MRGAAAAAVADDELRRALEAAVVPALGGRRIDAVTRRASLYHSSYPMEELTLALDDGSGLDLVFKDLSPTVMLEGARRVKPAFVLDPLREIAVYRSLLAPESLGTARLYGAVVDADRNRYWLFLEEVAGIELYQTGVDADWRAAAAWLGRAHRRLTGRLPDAPRLPLLDYGSALHRRWLRRAVRFADEADRRRLRPVIDRFDAVSEAASAVPRVVVHGEYYAANVVVERDAGRVCPVDWEMAGLGPGLLDLAALVAGTWDGDAVGAMAAAYVRAWAADAEPGPLQRVLPRALAACRVFMALRWLGWSTEWEAPPEHRHDWVEEAVRQMDAL